MPVTFFHNDHGKFTDVTGNTGVGDKTGWWNSIAAGDFRHTGRTDYIVGNLGLNSLYRASDRFPVRVTAGDFGNSGTYIAIPSIYLPDINGEKKEFPAMGRDDIARQMPAIKKKYPTYKPFATATMQDILSPEQWKKAIRLSANEMRSCYLRNDGNGRFTIIPLPVQAQVSVINGMVVDDFDGDGNLDVLLNGNDYGTEVGTGRYDALDGLLLKGDGAGNFVPQSIAASGIYIPGNGKALVKLRGVSGKYLVAASQHRGPLKLYELNYKPFSLHFEPDDAYALLHFTDGRIQKTEAYLGTSFLSQSGSMFIAGKGISNVEIFNNKGASRKVNMSP
jgi:hypothetical protein